MNKMQAAMIAVYSTNRLHVAEHLLRTNHRWCRRTKRSTWELAAKSVTNFPTTFGHPAWSTKYYTTEQTHAYMQSICFIWERSKTLSMKSILWQIIRTSAHLIQHGITQCTQSQTSYKILLKKVYHVLLYIKKFHTQHILPLWSSSLEGKELI